MFWKIEKPQWSELDWLITLSLPTMQFPEVDYLSKISPEVPHKSYPEEEKQLFPFKKVYWYAHEALSRSGRMLFLLSSDKQSIMFWIALQSDGRKMLV